MVGEQWCEKQWRQSQETAGPAGDTDTTTLSLCDEDTLSTNARSCGDFDEGDYGFLASPRIRSAALCRLTFLQIRLRVTTCA